MRLQSASTIPLGTVLVEKYRVTREIGRGGMAAVYEAQHIDIGKRVAVKVLAAELTGSAVVVERFLREARAAASVSSPHICDIYDSGKLEDGRPFLILELLEGESLYERMTRVRQIDPATTVRVVQHVARGLSTAHAAGIVHRDLKPENIFLTRDSEGELLAKILDFGLAKFYAPIGGDAAQARLTREGAVFGTPAYMSPEQVKGQDQVDHRADIWALGCIAYECLTGRTVWATDQGVAMTFAQVASAPLPDVQLFRPDLPLTFRDWFARALAREPEERFQTARELADALATALFGAPDGAPAADDDLRPPVSRRPGEPSSRRFPDPLSVREPVSSRAVPDRVLSQRSRPSDAHRESRDRAAAAPGPAADTANATVPKARGGWGRAALTWLGVIAIAGGGYAGWLLVLHPNAGPLPTPAPLATSIERVPSASSTAGSDPAEPSWTKATRWAALVGSAQGQIAASSLKDAIKTLREASDTAGASGATRALLEQTQIAASTKGACRLTGLARPRPYSLSNAAGHPAIAFTPRGALVAWTDNHDTSTGEHVYSIRLDGALRPAVDLHDVTPEAGAVTNAQLFAIGDRVGVLYVDAKGSDVGVHARWLDTEGRIAGPARALSGRRAPLSGPSIDRAPDGTFWVTWEEDRRAETSDLFLRHLSAELEPLGEVLRASEYLTKGKPHVHSPFVGVAGGSLTVVYQLERDQVHYAAAQRLDLSDSAVSVGLEPLDPKEAKGPFKDRMLGELTILNPDKDRANAPRVDCSAEGCFAVWSTDDGSAFAAYLEPAKGEMLWRKRFDKKSSHPTVAIAPSGMTEVAWFGHGRISLASIARDGIGQPTTLARATGDAPAPSLTPGGAPGEWYLAWQDSEAGHAEVYAARALCK